MEYARLAGILRRNALRIALFAALVGLGVGVVTSLMPKMYQASTKLVVAGAMLGDPPQIDQIQAATRMAQTLAELATSRPVLAAALATARDPTTPDAFRDQLSVHAAPDSLFVIVTVQATDAQSSASLANAVARQLIIQAPLLLGATSPAATSPSIRSRAPCPRRPTSPRVMLYALLAVVTAVFVAIVVAIIADYRRRPAGAARGRKLPLSPRQSTTTRPRSPRLQLRPSDRGGPARHGGVPAGAGAAPAVMTTPGVTPSPPVTAESPRIVARPVPSAAV